MRCSRIDRVFMAMFIVLACALAVILISRLLSARALAAPLAASAGVTRYVSLAGSDTANNCLVSTAPCRTIQRGMAVAQSGDEIHAAAGTYTGTMYEPKALSGVTATLVLTRNLLAVLGGYAPDFATRNPDVHISILSAADYTATFVVFISGTSTLIDGFTLTGASGAYPGDGNDIQYIGGAIRVQSGAPTISHNRINHNLGLFRGGGIYATSQASVTISSNIIYSNTTDGDGGAIFVASAAAIISGNTITGNVAATNGSAVMATGASVSIMDNTVAYNHVATAVSNGAAIRITGAQPVTISHNAVYSNTLEGSDGNAIAVNAPALIDSNDVHHNSGTINRSSIEVSGNWAVTLVNNVVTRNAGGGIAAYDYGDLRLMNNTVAGNVLGQGIIVVGADIPPHPLTATLYNNIAVNNGQCGISSNGMANLVEDYNDSWGNGLTCALTGVHDLAADPQFVSAAAGNYRLRFGSPAMNAGTSAGAPLQDMDGVSRPQMGRVDMGAYEVVPAHGLYLPVVRKD